jgi:hypothetical protein
MNMRTLIGAILVALLLALSGISPVASAAEPAADLFRSVVTAENLDIANTAEFPANLDDFPRNSDDGQAVEIFFLDHLGIRVNPSQSRYGWETGKTEERWRHFRVAFKEPLPVGTILGAGGEFSYLRPDAPFPGDVAIDAQWVSVPLPEGQTGLRVWTLPPGVVTRALRFSFSDTPAPGKSSRSCLWGALILAERLYNLTPEADAYASSERIIKPGERLRDAYRVGNLVNELNRTKLDAIGYPYQTGQWTAAPSQDVSREHPQWVVLAWPEAKTFSGIGLVDVFAKEIEIDALKSDATGHPATAPESAWNMVGAVTWPAIFRPQYTSVQTPFAVPVTTRALRVRIVKTLSDENQNPFVKGHLERNPADRNRLVRLGGVMAFATLGDKPIPPRSAKAEQEPPLKVHYTMPYAGTVTMAIDDAKGRRVRNLIACVNRPAGPQAEPWDGLDEDGNPVPPGSYTVKGITHQPLHLNYRGTVNVSGNPPWNTSWHNQHGPGGWLSDHETPNDVMAIGERMFVSATLAESAHGILACDLDGNKLWGEHRFGGGKGLAYAGFLAHDGGKVYTAGAGWGEFMTVTEIDPVTFAARPSFIRLDFSSGDAAPGTSFLQGGGLSGLAAQKGKLYATFHTAPLSWLQRSAINTTKVDAKETTLGERTLDQLLALLRAKGEVIREPWRPAESTAPMQHLRLAFTEPQAIGTLILPDAVERSWSTRKPPKAIGTLILPDAVDVSALKSDAAFPGDLNDDSQWIPFSAAPGTRRGEAKDEDGPLRVLTAPAGQAATRALRFTFRNVDGKPWRGALHGAHLLPRRFENITAGAAFTASSGTVGPDGEWETVRETPITPENPATLTVAWPETRTWRGLALLGAFARRIAVDAYTGPADADPAAAPASAWSQVGELTTVVRSQPMWRDDYFDAGRDVTSRAIRLRVLEPWVQESVDPEIAYYTKGKQTRAALAGLVVLRHLGDDPPCEAIPPQRISIADIATGEWERHVAVAEPSWPTFDPQGRLLLVSRKQVVQIDLGSGATKPVLLEGAVEDPRGLAFDAKGNLYVADGGPNVVKVFAVDGKLLRTIGEPGGREIGNYNPRRIENPHGIAIDARGNLWVAERDYQPKRVSVWSPDGKFLKEFIGPSNYGGGGQVDPRDPSSIYYQGMEFSLDDTSGQWALKRILSRSVLPASGYGTGTRFDARGQPAFTLAEHSSALPDKPIYLNGRQYMVTDPSDLRCPLLLIGEFRKDRVVPLTVVGNADRWWPLVNDPALRGLAGGRRLEDISFAWSDQNGDGKPQPGEVEVFDFRLDPTYWPSVANGRLEVQMGRRVLKPVEFTKVGAPVYHPDAVAKQLWTGKMWDERIGEFPISGVYATAVDSSEGLLINANPLTGLSPDGNVVWTYPNRFIGVIGSHSAPDRQDGQLAGTLGFVGQEELPGIGEVFMLNSNMGEWYLFTADGLLAATVWHDHRKPGAYFWDSLSKAELGMSMDAITLSGEHFGGSFQRAENGKFYLVAGHHHTSVVELSGLETMKRLESKMTVSRDDVAAVEAWRLRRELAAASKAVPKSVTLAAPSAPVKPDGNLGEWDAADFTAIAERGAFAVKADDKNLYVAWRVDGGQPLRNFGNEPQLLFKSGDSVDLQIGVNPDADPKRSGPVPGDQRLLVSLFQDKPIGVLYRHRVPGTPEKERIGFSSPWRTETVDRIEQLDPANIGIAPAPKGYSVEAVVPFELLGLKPQPGKSYKIDFGILSADSGGKVTVVRSYWANQNTGLVSDVPGEIMLAPGLWGDVNLAK